MALRVRTGWHLHELLFSALAPAMPDRVQAGSGLACLLTASGRRPDGRAFSDHVFLAGGQGASEGVDGRAALIFPTSAGNTSIEMLEQRSPVVVEHKGYADDSAGDGASRGGEGERFAMRALDDEGVSVQVSVLPEGLRAAPPGLLGGRPGAPARLFVDGTELPEGGLVDLGDGALSQDRRRQPTLLSVHMPGGGGYGTPAGDDDEGT